MTILSKASAGWLVVIVIVLGLAWPARAAQPADDRDARLAALQARVDKLEAMVDQLSRAVALPPTDGMPLASIEEIEPTPPSEADQVAASPATPARSRVPQELLPNLGKIGAAAAFLAGAHSGPFDLNAGSYFGGSVELPLARVPAGRLHYEFSAGYGRSGTSAHVTSDVAQVANLAVLANTHPDGGSANVDAALSGREPAPFAVSYEVDSRLQLLKVVPFGLKYVNTSFDSVGVRPYGAVGLATFVTITNQQTTSVADPGPFAGALIGGQITAARELARTGVPSGQGGVEIGVEAGGGVEWRAWTGVSFALDVRVNWPANGRSFVTVVTRTGLHF